MAKIARIRPFVICDKVDILKFLDGVVEAVEAGEVTAISIATLTPNGRVTADWRCSEGDALAMIGASTMLTNDLILNAFSQDCGERDSAG